jgi:hypothetical protein
MRIISLLGKRIPHLGETAFLFLVFGKRNLSGENIGRLDQLVAQGPDRGLGAVINSQFIEDIDYMAFDGMRTDLQRFGDLPISGPLGYQAQNLQFPLGQN